MADVTVPTVWLFLPFLCAFVVLWFIAWSALWDRFVEPPLRRWLYRRMGIPEDFDENYPREYFDELRGRGRREPESRC